MNISLLGSIQNPHQQVTLHEDIAQGEAGIVRLLLECGSDINATDEDMQTPLHMACIFGDLHMAAELLSKGANVNCQDISKSTPLHTAVHFGNLPLVELLVENGASLNLTDEGNDTPVTKAVLGDNLEIIQYFLNQLLIRGTNLDTSYWYSNFNLLHYSISVRRLNALKMLVEEFNMDVNLDSDAGTPLELIAARTCKTPNLATVDMDMIQYLIDKGAKVTIAGAVDAILNRRPEVLRVLLASGQVNLNYKPDSSSWVRDSLPVVAYKSGQQDIVNDLIEYGLSSNDADIRNRTLIEAAALTEPSILFQLHHKCKVTGPLLTPEQATEALFVMMSVNTHMNLRFLLLKGADLWKTNQTEESYFKLMIYKDAATLITLLDEIWDFYDAVPDTSEKQSLLNKYKTMFFDELITLFYYGLELNKVNAKGDEVAEFILFKSYTTGRLQTLFNEADSPFLKLAAESGCSKTCRALIKNFGVNPAEDLNLPFKREKLSKRNLRRGKLNANHATLYADAVAREHGHIVLADELFGMRKEVETNMATLKKQKKEEDHKAIIEAIREELMKKREKREEQEKQKAIEEIHEQSRQRFHDSPQSSVMSSAPSFYQQSLYSQIAIGTRGISKHRYMMENPVTKSNKREQNTSDLDSSVREAAEAAARSASSASHPPIALESDIFEKLDSFIKKQNKYGKFNLTRVLELIKSLGASERTKNQTSGSHRVYVALNGKSWSSPGSLPKDVDIFDTHYYGQLIEFITEGLLDGRGYAERSLAHP